MRAAALLIFVAGVLLGFDLTWWMTHAHCKWAPWNCIHFWHHVLFAGLYLLAAYAGWRRIERG